MPIAAMKMVNRRPIGCWLKSTISEKPMLATVMKVSYRLSIQVAPGQPMYI